VRRHTALGSESPIRVRSASGTNKAFMHHLKNFDKFATVKGRGSCNAGCPICKAIVAANVALGNEDIPSPGNTPPMISHRALAGKNADSPSNQRMGRSYPLNAAHVNDFQDDDDDEAYQKERRQKAFLRDLTKRGAKVARVVADRVSRHARELTVTKGEYMEVLDDTRHWWACSDVSGQLGYVPANILVSVAFEEINLSGR